MNKFFVSGYVANDSEIRFTATTNAKVASFNLASNYGKGENKKTDFFKCIAYGKLADFCESYVKKGRKFLVEGEVHIRNYDDKEGKKVYITEVTVNNMEFADSKPTEQTNVQTEFETDLELPF